MDFFNNKNEATEFLRQSINDCYANQSCIKDENVVLSDINVTITPFVDELGKNMVSTGYYISNPEWDTDLYECSAAIGKNHKDAIGMAQGSFMFGIMDAVGNMMTDANGCEFESEFAGHKHTWKVYLGNIVGMGKTPENTTADMYWEVLKEHIAKRIGNQKMCYIKIFASNSGSGAITGECRINNIKSDELSEIVADMAKKWNTNGFGSHKQFFMIKQDKETLLDYPFTPAEIVNKTSIAMKLFESCKTEEDYDNFSETLEKAIGDKSLAYEMYSFIPEICAQNAFHEIIYPETIMMYIGGESRQYYKTQLASYYAIVNGVFETLDSGILENTNQVYKDYIYTSSLCKALNAALENGTKLEDVGSPCIMYNMEDDYIVR